MLGAVTPDYAMPWAKARTEFLSLLGQRTFWQDASPDQREGALKALTFAYLHSEGTDEIVRQYQMLMDEFNRRSVFVAFMLTRKALKNLNEVLA